MACPLWGDGSKWGDGDLWCRGYGSQRYISDPIDHKAFHRVAIEFAITNGTGVTLDRLSMLLNQQQDEPYTYVANTDVATLSRVAVEINVSNNTGFVINAINPEINIKPHDPIG